MSDRQARRPRYFSRLLELAFLPPNLVEAILAGTQPAEMTAEALTRRERGADEERGLTRPQFPRHLTKAVGGWSGLQELNLSS